MKKFQLSFQARKINAIGIVYNNSATVVADNLQEATNYLYTIFEHIKDIKIVKKTKTNMEKGIVPRGTLPTWGLPP